jgi:hypothetical protein
MLARGPPRFVFARCDREPRSTRLALRRSTAAERGGGAGYDKRR